MIHKESIYFKWDLAKGRALYYMVYIINWLQLPIRLVVSLSFIILAEYPSFIMFASAAWLIILFLEP